MSIDPREFRNAIGCFATGITVITTIDRDGHPVGLTANSFTSLSLDPPMVLFCLDRKVASFDSFQKDSSFNVNILGADQEDISNRFAKSGSEKWNGFEFDPGHNSCPLLPGSIASFECRTVELFVGGDHVIVTGEVTSMVAAEGDPDPILYYRGRYMRLGS
jgi:flavin reductase (DIM6/NTAB) family NADH-FMN oxidoreductase RutF